MKDKNFLKALATLTGTIIGVGFFSLPYITSKVGIWVMLFYFLILGGIIALYGFIYGEISLRTKGLHRLPGYAEKYLGQRGKKIAFISNLIGFSGAILAYFIIGGGFLRSLFQPVLGGSDTVYTLIYFSIGAILIYFGIKSIARVEFLLLILFFVVLGLIFIKGFSLIRVEHFFAFDPKLLFLPYGAVLFSLSSAALIPEIKEMLEDKRNLKKIVFLSVLISALVYLLFVFVILGITGSSTSTDAITGLRNLLGNGIIVLALVFGLLATFTSYITLGLTFKKIFWYDLNLKKNLSWALACFIPLILFFFGFNNFITVVSLVGGVLIGIDVVLMILIYLKAKKKGDLTPAYSLNLPRLLVYFLILLFILGAVYEVYYFIR